MKSTRRALLKTAMELTTLTHSPSLVKARTLAAPSKIIMPELPKLEWDSLINRARTEQVMDEAGVDAIVAMKPSHASILQSARRDELLAIPASVETREAAIDLRSRLRDRTNTIPGAHYQIGKYYPYLNTLQNDECHDMIKQLKTMLDPKGLLNPGGLGIDLTPVQTRT